MSATDAREQKKTFAKLPVHQLNPSYTVRVICCVFFIFLTEILLAHYVYRLMNSEIREDYVSKHSFHHHFLLELRNDDFRNEVTRIFKELSNVDNSLSRKKRSVKHKLDYNYLEVQAEEPQVEFFNQKTKLVGDEKDEENLRKPGKKEVAPGGDSWIWVTSSSRIPEKALEGYCQKVQEFCPKNAGPQGPPGQKGEQGQQGLRGFPGIPGDMGNRGFAGPKGSTGSKGEPGLNGLKGDKGDRGFYGSPGLPGEKGEQGRPGLDGRDGLPGEPGLYGRPGRNGYDGAPGKDGIPGMDGKDGINGMKGERGLTGPQGPRGLTGLPGPRGRPGKPGTHGTPGVPGITAWEFTDKNTSKLLIPPSIAGAPGKIGPYIVHERDNVNLQCLASGTPPPRTLWQRLDNRPVIMGTWQELQVPGPNLSIPQITRDHMGIYMCTADNGVPPQANRTYLVEVHFPPLVRISNQNVPAANGSTAVLECETEAFPEPLRYWERSDGRLLENSDKFRIDNSLERNGYRFRMQLNITKVNSNDFNYKYYCISKNELQTTKGEFQLGKYTSDQSLYTERGKGPVLFGMVPPEKVSLEDLCGPPIQCPECDFKEQKCISGGVSLVDLISHWEVRPYNEDITYSGFPNRVKDCVLYAVGKPVFLRTTEDQFGCWMRDSNPVSDKDEMKFWVTKESYPDKLFEYANKTMYRNDTHTAVYDLDHPFGGNTHVIYNGNFFYNIKDTLRIVRYNLLNQTTVPLDLPSSDSNPKFNNNKSIKLYKSQYNTVDFNVDDNGLWIIFAVPGSNNTAIMKVNTETMKAQYIWNISLEHQKVGEMFIVCGVLYAVDSVTDRNTKIRFAFDLYKNNLLDVNLAFTNPFRKTTMLGYNARNQELYSWDKGNQLTYPVRYHDIGYNSTTASGKDDKSEILDSI